MLIPRLIVKGGRARQPPKEDMWRANELMVLSCDRHSVALRPTRSEKGRLMSPTTQGRQRVMHEERTRGPSLIKGSLAKFKTPAICSN
ncbi:hypothetical protein AVEN_100843-1 [Araneus ventricosus]|uniref:Uncharacterized protein n=1 Tax=Araneus ventricosus TaxID=182803 RepID=A0A4Y2AWP6_ARAVE|nr:hypothetical protein AVEN_100843-1 [Araneus ventricosus]